MHLDYLKTQRDIADFSLKLVAFFKIVGHGNVIKKDISCTLLT